MKVYAFTIHDSKAECFSPPFWYPATGQAIRTFTEMANDPNHAIGKHPGDYRLYRVGEFDDNSGNISQEGTVPILLCTGDEALNSPSRGLKVG